MVLLRNTEGRHGWQLEWMEAPKNIRHLSGRHWLRAQSIPERWEKGEKEAG